MSKVNLMKYKLFGITPKKLTVDELISIIRKAENNPVLVAVTENDTIYIKKRVGLSKWERIVAINDNYATAIESNYSTSYKIINLMASFKNTYITKE